jgi:hypothetical protein
MSALRVSAQVGDECLACHSSLRDSLPCERCVQMCKVEGGRGGGGEEVWQGRVRVFVLKCYLVDWSVRVCVRVRACVWDGPPEWPRSSMSRATDPFLVAPVDVDDAEAAEERRVKHPRRVARHDNCTLAHVVPGPCMHAAWHSTRA